MYDTQDIIDNLDLVRTRQLVCKLNHAFIPNFSNFVQVALDVISDEALYVKTTDLEENIFDFNSKSSVCYVKMDFFRNVMTDEEWNECDTNRYSDDTLEKDIDIIERYLKNKLVVIEPYFYFNKDKNIFFKNGTVSKIISTTKPEIEPYITIPIIPNEETYQKMISGEPFALVSNPKSIMGTPEYLYYQNKLFKVSLKGITNNDSYWQLDESVVDNKIELDYLDNKMFDEDIIKSSTNNFIFISSDVIFNSSRMVEKEEPVLTSNEEVVGEYNESGVARVLNEFLNFTKRKNLCYSKNDIYNFYTCIKSSQLIILAGMSGTGKTKLPLRYAEFFNMNEEDNTLLFVPVSPSFTEPSDVLGFLNPNTGNYIPSETRLVEFLKHASDNPNKMHMVIFDEMNLAQIEFWFAPFISILEKDLKNRYLYLYSENQECKNKDKYPYKIKVGRNIILVGTINLDETTKNISDRLIDRSYIINLKKESFSYYQAQQASISEDSNEKYDGDYYHDLMPNYDIDEVNYIKNFNLRQLEFFDKVHEVLNRMDQEKGVSFRCVKNISIFLMNKPNELSDKLAFDYALKQTVMKKINGSNEGIERLLGYVDKDGNPHGILADVFDEFSDLSDFKECRAEIKTKINELKNYGYAR